MTTNNSDDWVTEGTPKENWDADTDYGMEIDPNWDDYADEQAVHVPTPAAARDYRRGAEEQREKLPDDAQPGQSTADASEQPKDQLPQQTDQTGEAAVELQPERVVHVSDLLLAQRYPDPDPVVTDDPAARQTPQDSVAEQAEQEPLPKAEKPAPEKPAVVVHDDSQPEEAESAADSVERSAPEQVMQPEISHGEPTGTAQQQTAEPKPQEEPHRPIAPTAPVAAEGTVHPQEQTQPELAEKEQPPLAAAGAVLEPEPQQQIPTQQAVPQQSVPDEHAGFRRVSPTEAANPAETQATPPAEEVASEPDESLVETAVVAQSLDQTQVRPRPSVVAAEEPLVEPASAVTEEANAGVPEGLYRSDTEQLTTVVGEQETQLLEQTRLAEEEEAERAEQARLAEQREARDARLGMVTASPETGFREVAVPVKRQADRFFGAFSLFVLRVVVALIIGVLAYQDLQDIGASTAYLETTAVPQPQLVAWLLGFGLAVIAGMLVFGFGVRIAGSLLFLVSIGSLILFRWGSFSIFQPGAEGFLGDRTLLTAAVALMFVAFGAGRFSIDGAIYAARQESKAAKTD